MKNFLTTVILVTVVIHQIKCFYIGDEPEPHQTDEKNFVDKVKDGVVSIKQSIQSTYQGAKCKLHQVGNKIHPHSHTVDPCVGEIPEIPRTSKDPSYYKLDLQDNGNSHDSAAPHDNGYAHNNGISHGNGDDTAGLQGGEPGGRRLSNAGSTYNADRPDIDIRHD